MPCKEVVFFADLQSSEMLEQATGVLGRFVVLAHGLNTTYVFFQSQVLSVLLMNNLWTLVSFFPSSLSLIETNKIVIACYLIIVVISKCHYLG